MGPLVRVGAALDHTLHRLGLTLMFNPLCMRLCALPWVREWERHKTTGSPSRATPHSPQLKGTHAPRR